MLLFGMSSYQYVLLLFHTCLFLFGAKVARIIELTKGNADFRAKSGFFFDLARKLAETYEGTSDISS